MEKKHASFSENVTRGADGKYRWVCAVSLYKNPTIFFLVWKIFFFIFVGIFGFMLILDAVSWGWKQALGNLPFLGCFLIGMTAVVGLSYLIYAVIMGGRYVVEFEMDEKGILHRQIAAQAKKARAIGRAAMLAGAASRRIGTVGAGMNAQRTEMYTEFAKVRKVKTYPRRHLIKVNELFGHNQVYTAKEDFEFVKDYIVSHCPNTKNKRDT